MNREQFARKLVESVDESSKTLLEQHPQLCDVELAKCLQQICYEVWTGEPQKVSRIVEVLQNLADVPDENAGITAYYEWTRAIESLVNGRLEECLSWLDKSEQSFKNSGENHTAATTQISKLYALALLGRYDEAVACGLKAREVFTAHHDFYSVGKIEHNIGNLYWRRDFYRESEPYLTSAHQHFANINDQRQLAMVENCQAFVAALQNNFREAEAIYQKALDRTIEHNLTVTEAEIETGMSNLYLFQGRLDLALKFMERSRQKYDSLAMPHQSANCELEIADIYLELNLLPEAVHFYEKVEAKFDELGMQAELARALLNHARALFALNELETATNLLERAEKLFESEGNPISVASVKLIKAQSFYRSHNFAEAETQAESALQVFIDGGNQRHQLLTKWLLGELWAKRGENERAEVVFREVLQSDNESLHIKYLCLVSLGKLVNEEKYFLEAVNLIENSRSALSAEEFRTAFFSDKLAPYNELVKIKLNKKNLAEALIWHENSRSRTLLESMNGAAKDGLHNEKLKALREELNWFYSRINRKTSSGLEARQEVSELRKQAVERERELAEIERRLKANTVASAISNTKEFDLAKLQSLLTETTVIEFAIFDDLLLAFIITGDGFDVFKYSVDVKLLHETTKQFLFQIKTGRLLEKLSVESRQAAYSRLLRYSQTIYDALLRPLDKFCNGKRLTIVPASFLHYLPFQALHDGGRFLIEDKEITYAPSLRVLQNCLTRKTSPLDSALLVGVADSITPQVEREIETLGKLFKNSVTLKNDEATLENLCENIEAADVIHFACHGNFRLDNPNFSSLNLYTGNLTARDVQKLRLPDKFVALSACETGLNKIISGEELLGLTSAFLNAGASSLVMSLWTVNDKTTLNLMSSFYRECLSGKNLGEALQSAQMQVLKENNHPYFWSPFSLTGHW